MLSVVAGHDSGRAVRWLVAGVLLTTACGDGADTAAAAGDDPAMGSMDAGGDAGQDATVGAEPVMDASSGDAASDATMPGPRDAGPDPTDSAVPNPLPMSLFETGLYADDSMAQLAAGVRPFTPRSPLWSDGASKRRFLYLPPGTRIDVSDIDGWVFPVGTKAWKEFADGNTLIETRLVEKRPEGWFMMAYAWNAEGTDARAVIDGVANALGTQLDIPAASVCVECHDGATDTVLGASALQLGYDGAPLSLQDLEAAGLLSATPAQTTFALPGDADAQLTLGYLSANCGHCHNPLSPNYGMGGEMNLLLGVGELATVAATPAYVTTVGVDLDSSLAGYAQRIVAGDPSMSGLVARMAADKTEDHAMPPIATEVVDQAALQTIRDWIAAL